MKALGAIMSTSEPAVDEIRISGGSTHGFRRTPEVSLGRLTVFVGKNNAGKSRLLQWLANCASISGSRTGRAEYLPPIKSRIASDLSSGPASSGQRAEARYRSTEAGIEHIPDRWPDPLLRLASLPASQRNTAIELHGKIFGHIVEFRRSEENDLAPAVPTIGGIRPRFEGTGSLSVLAIIGSLVDPEVDWIFIDEPETGIEPEVQKRLMGLIRQFSMGESGFAPKRVAIATHSALFLDRFQLSNNKIVTPTADGGVEIRPVGSVQELQRVVFRLLGNSPDDLFLPRAVIVVEGRSDRVFVEAVLRELAIERVLAYDAEGDARLGPAASAIEYALKLMMPLPYRSLAYVLCDRSHNPKQVDEWRKVFTDQGGPRVLELSRNGIEFYFPKSVLSEVTGLREGAIDPAIEAFINDNADYERSHRSVPLPTIGSFHGAKVDLARAVARRLSPQSLREVDGSIREFIQRAAEANR